MSPENITREYHFKSPEEVLLDVGHLPVSILREKIRQQIRHSDHLVLVGETGSGKTTCLPQLLLEFRDELDLRGGIAVTQPRRVATRSITDRVASMMESEVGDRVGYHIRFENITEADTDITFMTDGILLRKIQFDPLLLEYSIVMVDEAHERSLNIDLCLGLLKQVNRLREQEDIEPLYLVISSATIERNKFAKYLANGGEESSIEIPGKMYPIQVFYEKEIPWGYDFTQAAAEKVKFIIDKKLPGDILIFMPGKHEISDTIEGISALVGDGSLEIIPLHAELPPEEQDRIFIPSEKRKVIVATNIAETSITIDGIVHVIDSGLIKETRFHSGSGIEQLVLTEHALSGLEQRKGRAGRTAPGFCYRLYTEDSLRYRRAYQTPEIQRSDLAQIVLAMKKVGIRDVTDFDFFDHPGNAALSQAIETLTLLGALDYEGKLTEIGDYMSEMGLDPRLSRMVIEATRPDVNCVSEICVIAAFLEGKNIFVHPTEELEEKKADHLHQQFTSGQDSDFSVILTIWRKYLESDFSDEWAKNNYLNEKSLSEAKNVYFELLDLLEKHGIKIDPNAPLTAKKDSIGRAITAGLLGNLMRYSRRTQLSKVDGKKGGIDIHPNSVLKNKPPHHGSLVISGEIFMSPKGRSYACDCLVVKPEWLWEISPQLAREILSHHNSKSGKSRQKGGKRQHHSKHLKKTA